MSAIERVFSDAEVKALKLVCTQAEALAKERSYYDAIDPAQMAELRAAIAVVNQMLGQKESR